MATTDELRPDSPGLAGTLVEPPPRLVPEEASDIVRTLYGVDGAASPLDSERDANFRIDAPDASYVLKVYNPAESDALVSMQTEMMLHVPSVDPELPVPRVVATRDGELHGRVEHDGRAHAIHLITWLEGQRADPADFDEEALRAFGAVAARTGRALRGFFHPAARRALLWDVKHALRLRPLLDEVDDADRRAIAARVLDSFEERVVPKLPSLRAQVIHNDLTYDNVLVGPDLRPSGIVDFGDATHSPLLFDLAVALASFCIRDDLFERAEAFLRGYGEVTELEEDEAELLGGATSARMAASVLISAWRVARFPENADYITAFDARTWEVLAYLDELGAQEAGRRFRAAAAPATTLRLATRVEAPATDALLERRRRAFGPAATAPTYERPLHFVRGDGVWLVERDGRRYLDAYNNVPAVGHSHPRVVAAIAAQARLLNTNTRYLHETAVVLAERLTATLPASLDTCLFVNSGSEANELAWRLATAATGVGGALVSERAYHGVTAVMTDLSPSEWPSDSRPDYVATIPAPRRERAAAQEALRTLADRGHRPAAFFLDSAWTSDGIFTEAWDYAAAAVAAARNAGGLFVADEVQAGFARFGSSMWSFEPSGVEPDFVTMGKPMGNGHPVAAVVTRREIAAEFGRRQAPIFSTFGGNPVACAAALAVLDVIEEDGLRESVVAVGSHLRAGLDTLMRRHPAVQEVRGRGLLLGVELEDGAERVANELRGRGVLVGVTGPRDNVLKIRPPLVFRREHADLLVTALDEALAER